MLPLGDENHDRLRRPAVTTFLVAVNIIVFLYELTLDQDGSRSITRFVMSWGVVPREYALHTDLPPTIPLPFWTTILTSMFLHGGWMHLLGNMLYLWVFGDNVEDRFGRLGFLAFYLIAGTAGALAQIAVDPGSTLPSIGASGAISGVLGAYLVLFPHKRVRVLVFFFITEIPALFVIGLWAITQLVAGVGALGVRAEETGGVAYMAHIGGFATGVIIALLFRKVLVQRGQAPATWASR